MSDIFNEFYVIKIDEFFLRSIYFSSTHIIWPYTTAEIKKAKRYSKFKSALNIKDRLDAFYSTKKQEDVIGGIPVIEVYKVEETIKFEKI